MSESDSHIDHGSPQGAPASATATTPTTEHKLENAKLKSPSRPPVQSRNSINGPLYMQTINNKIVIRRVKRKGDGPLKNLARWLLDNQIGMWLSASLTLFVCDTVWRVSVAFG